MTTRTILPIALLTMVVLIALAIVMAIAGQPLAAIIIGMDAGLIGAALLALVLS